MTQDIEILIRAEKLGTEISPRDGERKAFARLHEAGLLRRNPHHYQITSKGRNRLVGLRTFLYAGR